MYYAQVRLGVRVIRKDFDDIEDARRYVLWWCRKFPRSKFTPSIGENGKLLEYVMRIDDDIISAGMDHSYRNINRDGTLSKRMALPL